MPRLFQIPGLVFFLASGSQEAWGLFEVTPRTVDGKRCIAPNEIRIRQVKKPMPEINIIFQCSLDIFALPISKESDCLVSIAIAMAISLLDAMCFEVAS